ncbi:F-box and leucine-rich repeat protein 13 [Osmerus eperlanus]|uniref:F-box and leucine-rich repeat protein 13 n=1 Tax=Osmerus eperlanus TaxID=29151 RepID=UPI002E0F9FC6
MASLQNVDPALKEYILKHSLPQIFQALLTGLCVSCPESPMHFMEMKIMALQENHQDMEIEWHTLIDNSERVAMTSLACRLVHNIIGSHENSLFHSHLVEKAYTCYRKCLLSMCFRAWKKFILEKRSEAVELMMNMDVANTHYSLWRQKVALGRWMEWVQIRKTRQNEAVKKIAQVWTVVYCKIIIGAWRFVVQDAKKTKDYFERLEGVSELNSQMSEVTMVEGKDSLSLLPCKVSLLIFHYLDVGDLLKCAEVCCTWRTIAQTCSLWSRINFSVERAWITDCTVGQILQKHRPFVVHLNMRACTSLQWPSITCISECRNLQELNLSECSNVNDEMVRMIVDSCPSLLYLNLSATLVTNGALRELSRICVNLQYLSLAGCRTFSDKGLQYLSTGRGCKNLLHLDLSSCTQISVEGFRHIAAGCPSLQELVFNDMPTLTDSCVLALISKLHSLSAVSLMDTPHLSDSAFKAIAEVANLRNFITEGNPRMTDISWKALCRSSPGLTRLHAAQCPRMTDVSLKAMGVLRNLLNINISHCCRVTDMGLRYLTESPSASRLLELNLDHCSRISDLSIMRVAQRCSQLRHLSVRYCENLTDAALEWLSNSSVISLDISGCNVQDQGLTLLGGNCGLKKLVASECVWITDISIEKFCREVPGLEQLDVSHCVSLSDQAIKALAFYCRALISLNMRGCPKMTDMAVQYLAGTGHFLRELDLSGCMLLTDKTARLLQRGCPQLCSISMNYCTAISKLAAVRLQTRVKLWEHSHDDAPYWFGYNNLDQLLQPIRKPGKVDDTWEEEEQATVLRNTSFHDNKRNERGVSLTCAANRSNRRMTTMKTGY